MNTKRPRDDRHQVGPGMWTVLGYRVLDAEGEEVEDAAPELGFVFGYGAILPGLEAAIAGAHEGDRRTAILAPGEAYGRRRPEARIEVDRAEFPPDVAAGDRFEAETEGGGLVVLRVLEVTPDVVVIDQNHPLAGQRVRFELEIRGVRPANAAELGQAEARLSAASAAPEGAAAPLISPQSLLRGPSRRYEKGPAAEPEGTEPGNGD